MPEYGSACWFSYPETSLMTCGTMYKAEPVTTQVYGSARIHLDLKGATVSLTASPEQGKPRFA